MAMAWTIEDVILGGPIAFNRHTIDPPREIRNRRELKGYLGLETRGEFQNIVLLE